MKSTKTVYSTPLPAKYLYRKFLFEQGLSLPYKIGCEVLASTDSRYQIKITQQNTEILVGRVLWVKHRNVEFPKAEIDCSDAWYHN